MGARRRLTAKKAARRRKRSEAAMAKFGLLLPLGLLCSFILSQVDARSKHYLIETEDSSSQEETNDGESFELELPPDPETATLNTLNRAGPGDPGDPLNPFQRSTGLPG